MACSGPVCAGIHVHRAGHLEVNCTAHAQLKPARVLRVHVVSCAADVLIVQRAQWQQHSCLNVILCPVRAQVFVHPVREYLGGYVSEMGEQRQHASGHSTIQGPLRRRLLLAIPGVVVGAHSDGHNLHISPSQRPLC